MNIPFVHYNIYILLNSLTISAEDRENGRTNDHKDEKGNNDGPNREFVFLLLGARGDLTSLGDVVVELGRGLTLLANL